MSTEPEIPEPGRLTPVCCATKIPADVKNRFLTLNQKYGDYPLDCFFVIIDDISKTYTEESEIDEDAGPTAAPFKDKMPRECCQILRRMRWETGSDIDYWNFVITDERSLQDDTVFLVHDRMGDGQVQFVRAAFEIAFFELTSYMTDEIGEFNIEADQEAARQTTDGVLRSDVVQARRGM